MERLSQRVLLIGWDGADWKMTNVLSEGGQLHQLTRLPAEAVHEHMQSIGLPHYRPQTHIRLGLAPAEIGQIDRAIRAFNVAIEQNPNIPFPRRCLAQLYERAKNDPAKAHEQRRKAGELRAAMGNGQADGKRT